MVIHHALVPNIRFAGHNKGMKKGSATKIKRILAIAILIPMASTLIYAPSAVSATKGKWYKEGYAAIMERDPSTLIKWGIKKKFGATGKPVKSKMQYFCATFTVWELEPNDATTNLTKKQKVTARTEWNSGCLAAAMSLRLSNF
jgi:hypothetical protein